MAAAPECTIESPQVKEIIIMAHYLPPVGIKAASRRGSKRSVVMASFSRGVLLLGLAVVVLVHAGEECRILSSCSLKMETWMLSCRRHETGL